MQVRDESPLVLFTGGGTGGHVFPGMAVLQELRGACSVRVAWIGASRGIERRIAREHGVPFYRIPTGKLRRYFSLENVRDVFRVAAGVLRSLAVIRALEPAVLFSKGGFVSVPPVIAARLLRVPVITHESDADPGLATRINARFSDRVLVAYDATRRHMRPGLRPRVIVTGNPLRAEVLHGDRARGLQWLGFSDADDRPVVLFVGGSQGAQQVNRLVAALEPEISTDWRIVHQTGEQGVARREPGHVAAPFFGPELPDLLAAADVLVCRAGASTLWEAAALSKPMLLVPLATGSRGDQVRNAALFVAAGGAESFTDPERLCEGVAHALRELRTDVGMRETMGARAHELVRVDASREIARIIRSYLDEE